MTPLIEIPAPPPARPLSPRATELVAAARELLEAEGPEALTMRELATRLGIRAPSIYKHFAGKEALETVLVEEGLLAMGTVCYRAVTRPGEPDQREPDPSRGGPREGGPIAALARAYRAEARRTPNLYRLVTRPDFPRADIVDGLEAWAGTPFRLATGEPYSAQALWAYVHGMVILEIDDRFLAGSDLDQTWARGIAAFESLT